ncbi:L-2-hydroxyglutarate oxidase [Opitutus sp. GAS368]|uniref:L-2-hydroxyglutarate oxidase n=1 Tax=Opitutus sp. GAS368 TaxID=1882749 RepID=UPI000879CB4C|nr:L-2-hydroxyglutarate oxidase [Opitutus sp. GAS368]SDS49470.1 L-2-hydroxyglutarate oxidase [Opitutus sp. GAS368]
MRIVVIGGGIVGLAVTRELLQSVPGAAVTLLEKEAEVGRHQSSHNSGVLHAGLYYQPGSLKARLAVEGIRLMTAFCREHGVAHEICGKVVVATEARELPALDTLWERGRRNGLRGLRRLTPGELREVEPNVAGVAAIHVPEEGIVDYQAVCAALRLVIESAGGTVGTGSRVNRIGETTTGWVVGTGTGIHECDYLINCAGLFSDRVAELAGIRRTVRIVPFRGEYFLLRPAAQSLVRHLVYPVPDSRFPFLGVHFTRMIHGGVEAGPNAVLALAREGYSWRDFSARDVADAVSFPGLWRFLKKYPALCGEEMVRSLSRRLACRSLQRLVPALTPDDLRPGGAGVRAQAMHGDGTLIQDFWLEQRPRALHVLNAPSPAATASLAIARELVSRLPFAPVRTGGLNPT